MQTSKCREIVWDFYKEQGRHDLPWRRTRSPYKILVSEIMLQQTQVERVLPYYKKWLQQFPTVQSLAQVPLSHVLIAWQGLGYNRRAKALWESARIVTNEYGGRFPRGRTELEALPGIGHYTAGAVLSFAHNSPEVLLETNIRTAITHHFFKNIDVVSDTELMEVLTKVLDQTNPREWNWALMDYGAHLKRSGIKINSKSKTYTKQSVFKGSDREIRGAILRALVGGKKSRTALLKLYGTDREKQTEIQIIKLLQENLIVKKGRNFDLP